MNIKQLTAKANFEVVFALGIAAIFILPSVVMAQDTRDIDIVIRNGDTVVNGKSIKQLTPKEKQRATADLQRLSDDRRGSRRFRPGRSQGDDLTNIGGENTVIEKRGNEWVLVDPSTTNRRQGPHFDKHQGRGREGVIIQRNGDGYDVYRGGDTTNAPLHLKRKLKDSTVAFNFHSDGDAGAMSFYDIPEHRELMRMHPGMEGMERMEGMGRMGRNLRNSQRFSYENTDASGITTSISFRVTEPMGERLNRIAGNDKTDLNITDIKLVPDFTSGKTTIMFDLPAKTTATVQLADSDGKTLWEEKASSAMFAKSFPLPLNGIYFLKVKQGGKTAVRQIFKEQ